MAAEDERYGHARGDELPPQLATGEGRRAWLREAKKRLEAERAASPQPVPRDRPKRVRQAKRRVDEELRTEVRANQADEAWRARGVAADGSRRMAPGTMKAFTPPRSRAAGSTSPTPTRRWSRGCAAGSRATTPKAVINEHQVILAAEIATARRRALEPMLDVAQHELHEASVTHTPGVLPADVRHA